MGTFDHHWNPLEEMPSSVTMVEMEKTTIFMVGSVPVYGDVILSPMAGYSDVPYRALCQSFGSAMNYTEFVPVEALIGKVRVNRFWRRLDKREGEFPVVFQIFGNDAAKILEAAQNIEELGPDIIDINMGCSTRRVSGRGAGVGMMPQPELVAETFRVLSKNLSVPITGKIRLGWDDKQKNYLQIARIMQDNGAAMVAIHGRTKVQKYSGVADWESIRILKDALDIPVIGNGDIQTPKEIDSMLKMTGCDAVMIGRGAIGNPWIFSRIRKEELTLKNYIDVIKFHVQAMVAYYGEKLGLTLFRKHLKRYFEDLPDASTYLPELLKITDLDRFSEQLSDIQLNFQPSLEMSL